MNANKIRMLVVLLWIVAVFANIMAFMSKRSLNSLGLLLLDIGVLWMSIRWSGFLKMRVYVYQGGEYKRVVGPKELFGSVGGFGGHIVIGDRFEVSAVYFAGKNHLSNRSINGFSINKMELAPIDESDERELGIFLEEE